MSDTVRRKLIEVALPPVSISAASTHQEAVDTSAIYALLDRSDDGHARALVGMGRIEGEEQVTHSFVVVETIALVRHRLGPEPAARVIDEFLPALRIIDVDAGLRERATAVVKPLSGGICLVVSVIRTRHARI